MINELRVDEYTGLFQEFAESAGEKETTKVVPNNLVIESVPSDLPSSYIIVEDELGYYIPAVKTADLIVNSGDFVNLLYVKGSEPIAFQQGSESSAGSGMLWQRVGGTGPDIYYNAGDVGIGKVVAPDAALEILSASQDQLRLTFEEDVKYTTLTVDTNHDLTVKTSSTGGFRYQPTTDQTDSFQILDADGGVPTFNVDLVDERVGIGTASPGAKLDVLNTSGAQLQLTHTDASKFVDFTLDTNHDLTITPSSTGNIIIQATSDTIDLLQVKNAAGTSTLEVDVATGTTGQVLGPKGSQANPGFSFVGDAATGFQWINSSSFGFSGNGTRLIVYKRIGSGGAQNNVVQFSTGTTADTFPAHSFLNDENTGLYRHNTDQLGLAVGGVGALYINASRQVKIADNVASPSVNSRLHVLDNDAVTAAVTDIVTLGHNSTGTPATDFGAGLLYQLENNTIADQDAARIAALWIDPTNGSEESALIFETLTGGGSLTEQMRIDDNGNVGIGTPTPSTRLDIDDGALEFAEMTAPGGGAVNTARDYADDDGSGNTRRQIIFNTGSAVTIAKEGGLATYTPTNVVTDRSYDADATSVAELADVLGTLIADFQAAGILA